MIQNGDHLEMVYGIGWVPHYSNDHQLSIGMPYYASIIFGYTPHDSWLASIQQH